MTRVRSFLHEPFLCCAPDTSTINCRPPLASAASVAGRTDGCREVGSVCLTEAENEGLSHP